jgi:hypothetical protein
MTTRSCHRKLFSHKARPLAVGPSKIASTRPSLPWRGRPGRRQGHHQSFPSQNIGKCLPFLFKLVMFPV